MAPLRSLQCLPLLVRGEQHRGKRADQISTRPLSQSLTLRVLLSRAHPTPRPPCACGRCPSSSSPPAARSLGSLHHSRGRASPAARRSLVRVRVRVSAGRVSAGRVSAGRVSAGWASTVGILGVRPDLDLCRKARATHLGQPSCRPPGGLAGGHVGVALDLDGDEGGGPRSDERRRDLAGSDVVRLGSGLGLG